MPNRESKWPRQRDGTHLKVVTRDQKSLWAECERLEYEVFLESGYTERHPQKRILSLDQYVNAEFLAAFMRADGTGGGTAEPMVGAMRVVIAPGAARMGPGLFPTVDAADALRMYPQARYTLMQMDPNEVVDIASMAVKRAHRTTGAALAMISEVIDRTLMQPPRRYGLAAIDTVFLEKLQTLCLPWRSLGPPTMYWGSITSANILDSFDVDYAGGTRGVRNK